LTFLHVTSSIARLHSETMKKRLALLLAASLLAACGGGSGGSNSGNGGGSVVAPGLPIPSEYAVAIDGNAVRMYNVEAATPTLASTSSLPGIPGTYARSGNTVTVTMPYHDIRNGMWVSLSFAAGTGGAATAGMYQVSVVDSNTFTVTDTASGTITGGTLLRDPVSTLPATYVQSGTSTITVTVPNHRLAVGYGVNLRFTSGGVSDFGGNVVSVVDVNTFTVTASAAATASGAVMVGIGTNYTSFDVVMHPSGKWLYVASGYDCRDGLPYCVGGDVITQYSIDWASGQLSAVDALRTSSSRAFPIKMAVNAAGTRLVNQDQILGGMRLWTIDTATGHLAQVADSGGNSTNSQGGIVFSADGSYIYNGSAAFQVGTAPDSLSLIASGDQSNAGQIVGTTLFSISNNSASIYTHALTDPAAPVQIAARVGITTNRDLAVAKSGSLIVASGPGGIQTFTYDGTTIAPATPATGAAAMQADGTPSLGGNGIMYRSVSMNDAGDMVASAYFTAGNGGRSTPSGVVFARLTADGALSRIVNLPDAQYARAVRFLKRPAQ
jgi:hypothetical protein